MNMTKRTIALFCLAVALGYLTGCGALQTNPALVKKDLNTTPEVLVIGDALVTAWLVADPQPMWVSSGAPVGTPELTNATLARMPVALAANHYDVVVILVGPDDMAQSDWTGPCGGNDPTVQTCTAMLSMLNLAHNVGAKVLWCTIPVALAPEQAVNEGYFNGNQIAIRGEAPPEDLSDGLVDLSRVTTWQEATQTTLVQVQALHVGGIK